MKTKIILLALLRLAIAILMMIAIFYFPTDYIIKYCSLTVNAVWKYFLEFFAFIYAFFWFRSLLEKLKAKKS